MSKLASIKFFLSGKDIKQLIDNFLSLTVLKVLNLIIPLITLPYLIKVLGFEKYGSIILALSLIQYFQAVTDYGFNLSATRDIAKHRHSKRQLSYIYSKVMGAKLVLIIISVMLILPIIFITPQFQNDKPIFLLMIPVLVGHALFPEWFFRGVERMRYITILDLSIKLFFTTGVFLLIKKPEDYWIYPMLNGIGYCVVAIFSHILISRRFSVNIVFVSFKYIKKTLKYGFSIFLNQFAPNLYNNTTTFLVGLVLGNYAAGFFGSVRQVLNFLSVFNSVVTMVAFPYLTRNKDKFKIFSKIYLFLFGFLLLFFVFLKDFILSFFNIPETVYSGFYYILLLGVMFTAIYSVYATNYLIVHNFDKTVLNITLVSSFVGIGISYPLVFYGGLTGAAATIAICQGIIGVLSFVMYSRLSKIKR